MANDQRYRRNAVCRLQCQAKAGLRQSNECLQKATSSRKRCQWSTARASELKLSELTCKAIKMTSLLLAFLLAAIPASANERTFTGSTPAALLVRSFLGISLVDSVDFIRWNLALEEGHYRLSCQYGIGKPNTNGFLNDGIKINLDGACTKKENRYELKHGPNRLSLLDLNGDLLHLLDTGNRLLVGNGGWSYTLSNISPSGKSDGLLSRSSPSFADSIVFVGRTPCGVPGLIAPGTRCYKLKWKLTLIAGKGTVKSGRYKVLGTPWRDGGRTGTWDLIKSATGATIYQLTDVSGNRFLFLLQVDENILFFTDAQGRLLVGNEDFSYTLNKMHGKK